MRRALLVLAAAARAADGLTVAYGGAGDDPANATTYTFANMPIGTASATRTVVAVIGLRATSPITVSGVTIGGVSATIDLSQANPDNTAYTATLVARATVPTGTTATVVANTSACIRALAATYVIGGDVAVAGTAASNATGIQTLTLSPGTGPVLIAAQSQGSTTALSITSGATQDAALISSESTSYRMTVGHSTASPASVVFGTNSNNPAGVAIAYEPA